MSPVCEVTDVGVSRRDNGERRSCEPSIDPIQEDRSVFITGLERSVGQVNGVGLKRGKAIEVWWENGKLEVAVRHRDILTPSSLVLWAELSPRNPFSKPTPKGVVFGDGAFER